MLNISFSVQLWPQQGHELINYCILKLSYRKHHFHLRLCLVPNCCKFRDKMYMVPDGVPKGSPLALMLLLPEIFMNHFEFQSYPTCRILASLCRRYSMSMEWIPPPTWRILKFPELTVSDNETRHIRNWRASNQFSGPFDRLSIVNTVHQFGTYFQETDVYRYNDRYRERLVLSYCPYIHAAYHSIINRLFSVPLDSNAFRHEVDIIKCIVKNNREYINIDNMISKEKLFVP